MTGLIAMMLLSYWERQMIKIIFLQKLYLVFYMLLQMMKPRLNNLNYYSRCVFPSDVSKGAHLLMEATLQGDVTAAQWLDKLNGKQ